MQQNTVFAGKVSAGKRRLVARLVFMTAVFASLAAMILSRPDRRLTDFDQSFYLTIAYDLVHHGTFSNGVFDTVDSTRARPAPGMFFAPLYPLVVAAASVVDRRFAATLDCTIEANETHRPLESCEIYARPLLLVHAALVTLGVIAIAATAETIFAGAAVFYLAGTLAAIGIGAESYLLSYLMTESLSFGLYGLFGWAFTRALAHGRWPHWAIAGLCGGVAALARPPFLLLVPLGLVLLVVAAAWRPQGTWQARQTLAAPRLAQRLGAAMPAAIAFVLAAALVLTPWYVRNVVSVGKAGFTEEYGAATLIERLAFDTMTGSEFAFAFPYCVPTVGPAAVKATVGGDAMARFEWDRPGSFFAEGRARREALVARHGRLDPIIGAVLRDDMARDWGRHLATSIALSWCGLWVSGLWSVPLLPLFAVALWRARRRAPLLLFYAAPALALVGAYGILANHYPRYNLGLIGPIAAGAAWVLVTAYRRFGRRQRAGSQT
jgi:hypothetical protein